MSKINTLFKEELKVVNIGLESFYDDLKDQEIESLQMNWKPRAGGNKKMASLLDRLKAKK